MYCALDIAKYIVNKCNSENNPISNLQLQKILFFIQKEILILNLPPLFDENFEAWQFGPVIPSVYYHYCAYGSMPIRSSGKVEDISNEYKHIIDKIVVLKRKLYPWDLVEESHKPDGAWSLIYKNGLGNKQPIPKELIKKMG